METLTARAGTDQALADLPCEGDPAADQRTAPILRELFGNEQLARHARHLAERQRVVRDDQRRLLSRLRRGVLLARLDETEEVLRAVHAELAELTRAGGSVSPAGEWLLDNFHVIRSQIAEVRATMPRGYYHELPKLAPPSPLAGYPRTYEIAIELIAHTDGRLDPETLGLMIEQYQVVAPLSMGELWAIPAMLRMGFLENIRRMALRAQRDAAETRAADEWVSRLLDADAAGGDALARALNSFVSHSPELTPAFLTRFLQQTRSRRADFTPLLWLGPWIGEEAMSVEEAVQRSTQRLALTQLVMANSIASLRKVVNIDWRDFVEAASLTEGILRRDPPDTYAKMTFATRDSYRHVIEQLARRLHCPEQQVATAAIQAATACCDELGPENPRAHVGYHLVDDGRAAFEQKIGYTPAVGERVRRAILGAPATVYMGCFAVLAAVVLSLALRPLGGAHGPALLLALFLALLPAADVAVTIVNQLVNLVLPPDRLPRMDFTTGVPPSARTVVVVPILLGSAETVREALEHLEAQFLANDDPQIRFALLGDFPDAANEHQPGDEEVIEAAVNGVRALNAEYARDEGSHRPFYHFHRARRWNGADGVWMGWERKRGKLADFNAFLLGAADRAFQVTEGDLSWLEGVRYVITLDSDTVLPRDAAVALVGTIAHPLNRAEFDEREGRVVRGYGILQPRVSVSLASANSSRFASIFAGHPGLDPYTTAVSDVYQDLFAEGTYTGKGIYDVPVFEQATAGRFPENALLSHDLIEGTFARAALVTDVEVFDDYPTRYLTSTRRLHRWIRGDWQLLPWLHSVVPGPRGRGANPLVPLSRWKILDNLRRSLAPVATLAWLVAGWTILPGAGVAWTLTVFAAFAFPWYAPLVIAALRPPRGESWRPYYAGLGHDASTVLLQFAITLVVLPHQALLAADAITRTLYRVLHSQRRMLEWRSARYEERISVSGRSEVWRRMGSSVLLAAVLLSLMWGGALFFGVGPVGVAVLTMLTIAWLLAPEVAFRLSAEPPRPQRVLAPDDRPIAERYAREHWLYFADTASASTHWLVPDNLQETPSPVLATRTSPTNIGLQLLATMSACDLGFIDVAEMTTRLERILDTVDLLAKVRGHLFNWYDLTDLHVLDPPYVSAVDSGNLAGHLLALAEGCSDLAAAGEANASRLSTIAGRARALAMAMDFSLFYDPRRRLLSIGYDARTGLLDDSSYDLLASEARLASFIAVAKGDVPVAHWFHLGRSLTVADGATALVSWSGSMFEYLMPILVMASRPFSLLDQTHHAAVRRQVAYGDARGAPWGISECAYNVRDRHETYQYRAFGVPDLALKRGLAADLVVAPYASALALAVDPVAAMRNLARLDALGARGRYGFYDSLDYTRGNADGTPAVVHAFMAHHVGMSLVALDNALHVSDGDGVWQSRFMRNPIVRAAALLLDERVPRRYTIQPAQSDLPIADIERSARERAVIREFDDANTTEPHVGLLGGQSYGVLLTNAGGGYSRVGPIDVFRWRADATKDDSGQWIYLRDVESGRVWSAAHQPVRAPADSYTATFASDRAVFSRCDDEIETRTDIAVVPRERAEVRRVTLVNRSSSVRHIELTSYGEIVLTDSGADRAHPAFQNLFVETEWLPEFGAVLASRRPRATTEPRRWLAHVVAVGRAQHGQTTCETDRARFIGRGRTVHDPVALDANSELSCSAGAVLDPIAALRIRLTLEPGRSAIVAFSTVVADSRDQALQAVDRYRDITASSRALALAGTEAQVEQRDLGISASDAGLYQDLAGALIYPRASLRASEAERRASTRGQQALWAQGISGDWPIVLATITAEVGLSSVRQLLAAHTYWRMKGVHCDLVILNAKAPSYVQDLQDQLRTMVLSSSEGGTLDAAAGVFIRRADLLAAEDVALLRAIAAIHVICDGVGLGEVVAATVDAPPVPTPPHPASRESGTPAPARNAASVNGNGYGALEPNDDYAIDVRGAHVPPAPWANVVANPSAGFCVTERGGGFAWAENSYFFRLTPWFNDPVSDPCGEVIYLRDEESGDWWTATPGPLSAVDDGTATAYRAVHAAGKSTFTHARAGIESMLEMAVPATDPVKISRLTLTNTSDRPRRLSITSFVELVLGTERERTRHQLHTWRDDATGALFARNYFIEEFAGCVAFSWISEPATSFTASRVEFLGRNGDLAWPAALAAATLRGDTGAGEDPCAALRCAVSLAPGESKEMVVLLGATRGEDEARAVIGRNGAPTASRSAMDDAVARWNARLSTIRVRTPSPELDTMVNRWSLYQALSCRMWARSALYQSSGAFGFRDQLQDGMAFEYADPDITRAHLLRSASHQFLAGDVQHWWHEPSGRGVRTRFSDDLAWLPFAADHYVCVTGDASVWDEVVPYIDMRPLAPDEHELYDQPTRSDVAESLYAHCVRALDKACTTGQHGLPLIGGGDWNDGMNRVGIEGRGESVWLAWFLVATLRRFAHHAELRGDHDVTTRYRAQADSYAAAVEREAWDGAWYRRAYFDDGTPLGSASSEECRIDAIAQSWAVLSEAGDHERREVAMHSLGEHLVRTDARIILLLTPPFDHSAHDPGYIMGYLPGVRENGAQYTHAALWTALAVARMGDGDRAFRLLQMLNPLTHASTTEDADRYKVEPYAVCADVYNAEGHVGRGGWTWYTGSASWSYRVALEGVLGFTRRGDRLFIAPCIPGTWKTFNLEYRYGASTYDVTVANPHAISTGSSRVVVDGVPAADDAIRLVDDGARHVVSVTLDGSRASSS
jgi:cyclic beta-1,2-glucan synthetase